MQKSSSICYSGQIVKTVAVALAICMLSRCKDPEVEDVRSQPAAKYAPAPSNSNNEKNDDNDDSDKDGGEESHGSGCSIDDGTHSARIDYDNPSTGYSATYTLDVEVEGCQVTRIDFNNGGYLGPHHIAPADIDEDGDASVVDDRGRSYDVHIDD